MYRAGTGSGEKWVVAGWKEEKKEFNLSIWFPFSSLNTIFFLLPLLFFGFSQIATECRTCISRSSLLPRATQHILTVAREFNQLNWIDKYHLTLLASSIYPAAAGIALNCAHTYDDHFSNNHYFDPFPPYHQLIHSNSISTGKCVVCFFKTSPIL